MANAANKLVELIRLATKAVDECNNALFVTILSRLGGSTGHWEGDHHAPLWTLVHKIGVAVRDGEMDNDEARRLLIPVLEASNGCTNTLCGHTSTTLVLLLDAMLNQSSARGSDVIQLLGFYAPCYRAKLVEMWRGIDVLGLVEAQHAFASVAGNNQVAFMRKLGRVTLHHLRYLGDRHQTAWEEIGTFLHTLSTMHANLEQDPVQLFVDFARVDQGRSLTLVTATEALAWRVATTMVRAQRRRHDELGFLAWLEASDVYKPTIEDGKIVAPKRCRADFEADGWCHRGVPRP